MNYIVNLIYKALEFVIKNLVDGSFKLLAGGVANVAASASVVLDMPIVVHAIAYTQALALSLLITKIAFEALTTYILRSGGDSTGDPSKLLFGTIESGFVIAAVPWLVRYLYKLGSNVAADMSSLSGVKLNTATTPIQKMWQTVVAGEPLTVLLFGIGLLIGIVMLVVVIIQSFIRAGELAVIAVTGSLMALSLSSGDGSGRFKTWWQELLTISATQAIQIFLIKLAFGAIEDTYISTSLSITNNPFTNLMLFIGILWVTIKSPNVLRTYIHSSGTGKVAGQAGNMIMMRKIMTKGR